MTGSYESFTDAGSPPISTSNPDIPLASFLSDAVSGLFKGGVEVLKDWGAKQLGVTKVDPAASAARSDAVSAQGKPTAIQASGVSAGQIALYGGIALAAVAGVVLIVKFSK